MPASEVGGVNVTTLPQWSLTNRLGCEDYIIAYYDNSPNEDIDSKAHRKIASILGPDKVGSANSLASFMSKLKS